MKNKITFLILVIFVLTGCNKKEEKIESERPYMYFVAPEVYFEYGAEFDPMKYVESYSGIITYKTTIDTTKVGTQKMSYLICSEEDETLCRSYAIIVHVHKEKETTPGEHHPHLSDDENIKTGANGDAYYMCNIDEYYMMEPIVKEDPPRSPFVFVMTPLENHRWFFGVYGTENLFYDGNYEKIEENIYYFTAIGNGPVKGNEISGYFKIEDDNYYYYPEGTPLEEVITTYPENYCKLIFE